MPIHPENRKRYPANWKQISRRIRKAAGNRCQWCGAENGSVNPQTGGRITLTVAHLDHTPENCAISNLRALCNACHLGYDIDRHVRNRQRNAKGYYIPGDGYKGVGKLF